MFNSKTAENGGKAMANAGEVAHPLAARTETTPVSCIGSGMTIVGSVECSGSASKASCALQTS
jgi:hypothetical protein